MQWRRLGQSIKANASSKILKKDLLQYFKTVKTNIFSNFNTEKLFYLL